MSSIEPAPSANHIELMGRSPARVLLRDVAPSLPDDVSLRDYLDVRLWPLERLSAQVEAIHTQVGAVQVQLASTISRVQYDEVIDRIGKLEQQLAVQRGFGSGSRAAWGVVLGTGAVVAGFAGAIVEALLRH